MTLQQTNEVTLNPVKDHEVVKQYENDPGWVKVGEGTTIVVFELKSSAVYLNDGIYLPSKEYYKEGIT